ncbi:Protein of unknown function (DUF1676) [Nesidiocoris tenuis]|uniref:Uncharacterized protein n=1 Tax=Nesidiocoris tenuis TaxID=355587 RepID=A0ABN7AWF3_9HEMI|nr:Protein of unknown function (DUF1676) [Nesidiocoris tenuis]
MKWSLFFVLVSALCVVFSNASVPESEIGNAERGRTSESSSQYRIDDEAKSSGAYAKSHGEGRKLRGGVMKRLALPFLLLLGLKAGITIPVIFGIVALVAFKGMWSGFTALFVTAALALRNLIPPSKIIQLPPANPQHVHVADYIGDYRREDHLSRIDDQSYHPYGVSAGTYLPPNY